jgi:hypothetical protein
MFLLRSGSFPNADGLLSSHRGGGCGLRPWRVGGVPVRSRFPAPPPPPPLPHFPFSSSFAAANRGKGQNPNAGRWVASRCVALGYRPPGRGGAGAKEFGAWGLDARAEGATWPRALGRRSPCLCGERAMGVFSFPRRFPRISHARWLGVWASRVTGRPIRRARERDWASQHRRFGGKSEKG